MKKYEDNKPGDSWRLDDAVRRRRLLEDARRPMSVNLAETIALSLSSPTNAVLGTPASATLTINANDGLMFSASTYSVNENGARRRSRPSSVGRLARR